MQDKYLKLMCLSTILVSVLLSVGVCHVLRQPMVSVDLMRILNAQAFSANKLISKNPGDKNWIHSIKEINASIKQTIRLITGKNTIVMVTPAIIQGVDDITDRVLVALGLSSKLPDLQAFIMPNQSPHE